MQIKLHEYAAKGGTCPAPLACGLKPSNGCKYNNYANISCMVNKQLAIHYYLLHYSSNHLTILEVISAKIRIHNAICA